MAFSVSESTVIIQFLVDTDSVQPNSTTGVYVVDNTTASNEGGTTLNTTCTSGTFIAWEVVPVRPCNGNTVSINSIGTSTAWGPDGQPETASDNPNAYAGQAQGTPSTTAYGYSATLVVDQGGSTITIPLTGLQLTITNS